MEIGKADDDVKRLEKWQDDCKLEEEKCFRKAVEIRDELHEAKLELELERQAKLVSGSLSKEVQEKQVEAKLPKLVISKFNGNYMDWPRFWGQFTESIGKSGLASIAKFSYLREILGDKVTREVESLPFTPEGYNRATAILEEKYGKESELVKSYVREILSLPYISMVNAKKIAEFSDKLTYCVQSLESLKKLDEVKGRTMVTIDKLPGVQGDLVRSDSEWETWNLVQLAEAVRLWLQRKPVDLSRDDKPRGCIYCESSEHKAVECTKVTAVADRKQILSTVRLEVIGLHNAKAKHHAKIVTRDTTPQYATNLKLKIRGKWY